MTKKIQKYTTTNISNYSELFVVHVIHDFIKNYSTRITKGKRTKDLYRQTLDWD